MKCVTQKDLIAYIEDRLTPGNKRDLERHLEHCKRCQRQLEQLVDGLEQETESLWSASFSEGLDQKIISALPSHPVSVLKRVTPSYKPPMWKKRSIDIMKKTTIAAVALAVTVSFGMVVSPTFATYVNGVFMSNPMNKSEPASLATKNLASLHNIGDFGIEEAVRKGFAQSLNLSTTDKGITLQVHGVVADPLRIGIVASVKDKNKKLTDEFSHSMLLKTASNGEILIRDKQGNVLQPGRSARPGTSSDWSSTFNKDGYMLLEHQLRSYFKDTTKLPDELIVEFRINKIGDTDGNWKLSVPVHLKKAKAATTTHAINQSYTTPQGLKLDVKQITFAPSGVEMVIDRSTTDNRKKEYSYQLMDAQGTLLGTVDSTNVESRTIQESNQIEWLGWDHTQPIEKGIRDFYYFQPMDPSKGLTFKLTSVYTEEPAALSAKLDLARLEKEPVTAEEQGSSYTFKKASVKEMEGYALEYQGILGEDAAPIFPSFSKNGTIKDENGKKYDFRLYINESKYQNGRMHIGGWIEVLGMKSMPKQLTFTYDKKMIWHRNVKWNVPILP